MNSYLLRRLFPFYILAVAAEFIFTVYSMAAADSPLDMSFFGIVKTFGILLLTTTSAFLVMMIPYVAYLMLCRKIGRTADLTSMFPISFIWFLPPVRLVRSCCRLISGNHRGCRPVWRLFATVIIIRGCWWPVCWRRRG